MNMLHLFVLLFILPIDALGSKSNSVCGGEVTFEMKCKLIKDCMEKAKTLYPTCRDPDIPKKCGKKETALAHIDLALETLNELKITFGKTECPKCPDPQQSSGPVDCSDVLRMGNKKSGVYTIYPRNRVNGTKPLKVYCDMKTEGGGWTVLQRRGNFSQLEDFRRGWEDYKKGFGNLEREFWLGNENIHTITNQGLYNLRFDLKDNFGVYRFAHYDSFWISNEYESYTLRVRDISYVNIISNTSDDFQVHNNFKFSTKDRQNDGHAVTDACADAFHGGWWYTNAGGCGLTNLNGLYIPGVANRNSAWWMGFTGHVGLFSVEMKIRHRSPELVDESQAAVFKER